MAPEPIEKMQLLIVTGPPGSGKSAFLNGVVKALQAAGIRAGGFIADKYLNNNQQYDYQIRDVQSGRTLSLASREHADGWIRTGNFYFNPEAVSFGNELLSDPQLKDTCLIVIDEIGPFELQDQIWASAVNRLLSGSDTTMLWVVRSALVEPVLKKWNISDPVIFNIERISVEEVTKQIRSKLATNH